MSTEQTESTDVRERKRAQFAQDSGSKKSKNLVIAILLLAAVGAGAYFAINSSSNRPVVIDRAPTADSAPPDNELRVSLNEVSSGKARFFDYKLPGNQDIRFFVVKSSAGDYRAALDACEVCAHSKKGYHQEGDDMVCNNCGKKFPTALIGKISGGCHPIGLNASQQGESIVVKKSDIEAGAKYFE